jgi:hypothetical protein
MDDGYVLGHHVSRTLKEDKRRERLEVRRISIQAGIEKILHGGVLLTRYRSCQVGARFSTKAPIPSTASSFSMLSTITADA